jgi:hypothetical protein
VDFRRDPPTARLQQVLPASWEPNVAFNKDMATVDQVLAADLNADSTDLRPFATNGGKLILYHGFA